MFMAPSAWNTAFESMKTFLPHFVWLNVFHDSEILFPLRPKAHFCYHVAWCCRYQNPKSFWTYKNESWVGNLAHMAHSCAQ